MKPNIKAFILTFNEADIIAFTIKHYQQFCSEIFIYDNYSTDNTREICSKMGCKVGLFGEEGKLDDRAYLQVKNNCWKSHRDADYVIVCDADEVLDLDAFWNSKYPFNCTRKPEQIFRGVGFQIYSETLPIESWSEKRVGYADKMYDKALMFDPVFIKEINYGYGAHGAKPTFNHYDPDIIVQNVNLYHMRYVGGFERLVSRYELYKQRMCEFNKVNGLGHQYLKSVIDLAKEWEEVKIKSKDILC